MGRMTRGTLLATLKELKKHPRPKSSYTTAVAVQAICPQKQNRKVSDLKEVIAKRRNILKGRDITLAGISYMEQYDAEMNDFLEQLRVMKALRSSKNNEAL